MKRKYQEKNIFRALRIIRDIKTKDLAKTLNVSPANISSIESGRHNPSKDLLPKYAQALGVTPEFINNHLTDHEKSKNETDQYQDYLFQVLNEVLTLDRDKSDNEEIWGAASPTSKQ